MSFLINSFTGWSIYNNL